MTAPIVKLFFPAALLPDGWAADVQITLDGPRIRAVRAGAPPDADAAAGGGIAIPGLGNLHCHAFQRGMAGLAERGGPRDDHFWTWREVMYRFLGVLTPDDVETIAALAYLEMLEAGYTRVGEFHYLHHAADGTPYDDPAELGARIAAAAAATGIGLTLLPSFYAHGGFGGAPATPGQRRFVTDLDGFARLLAASRRVVDGLPGAALGVAPHSLRAVTPAELAEVVRMADGAPVHIHAAEQVREVADCSAALGAPPVAWLLDHGAGPGWCLVHCTHLTEAEVAGLAASGAVAGLCPLTEASLGDGIFAGTAFLARGGAFGIGSDSNIQIDPAAELRALEYSQRLRDRARNRLAEPGQSTGRRLFDAALAGASGVLAVGPAGLAPGAMADIVVLDPDHAALTGRAGDAVLDSWIFAAGPRAVRHVHAGGRHVVRDGAHVGRESVLAAWRRCAARLAAAL